MNRWLGLALVTGLIGCDTLFPEFAGKPASAADGGGDGAADMDLGPGANTLSGSLCALSDLRDYRSCAPLLRAGFRVTVEETRDQTSTDALGHFTLPLAEPIPLATVAAIDPAGAYAPAILTVRSVEFAAGVSVPLVDAILLHGAALSGGFAIDPARGALLGYVVDAKGQPVAGVAAKVAPAGSGPFYDGAGAGELDPVGPTRAWGLIAVFDAAPAAATVSLTPASGAPWKGDQFSLPIRAGAVTTSLLPLPPL